MAKQNFLSGGFYGKLGQVVGQRWKNKRTIRSYVVPHDPKTPLQMEQRNAFGKAVVYAQSAMMSNYNSNWFDDPSMSRWNVRMSTARELIKKFTTFLARLPLIPENVEPPFPVSQIKFTQDAITHDITFTLNSDFPKAKRNISIYATNNPNTQNPDDVLLLVAENQDEYWKRFTIPNMQGFTFDNNTHLRIVSNDDTNSDRVGFVSNEQIGSVDFVEEYPFSLSIYKILVTSSKVQFLFNEKSLKQRNQVNADGFECFINGTKQLIEVAPLHIGYDSTYENRLSLSYTNVWGTTEQAIQFTSSCVFKNLRWTEANEDLTLKLIAPATDVPLIQAEYETITPFDATIYDLNIRASSAIVTFPAQTETPIEVAVDNVTVMYTENGTQKSKLVNTGITSRIEGNVIQLIIPLQNWWTTDCDGNTDISMAFSSLRFKDGSGNWHSFTGTEIAKSIHVVGYYYRQSDFTFSGISFSGNTATLEYTYPVVTSFPLNKVTTKTCGELSYVNANEPITETSLTVGNISTVNGKLQVPIILANLNNNFSLTTNQVKNLVLQGLVSEPSAGSTYSECENLSFTNNLVETAHEKYYFKPKSIVGFGYGTGIEYWDDFADEIIFVNVHEVELKCTLNGVTQNFFLEGFGDWDVCKLVSSGKTMAYSTESDIYPKYYNGNIKIITEAIEYKINGVTKTSPDWSGIVVQASVKGLTLSTAVNWEGFKVSGNKITFTGNETNLGTFTWGGSQTKNIEIGNLSYKSTGGSQVEKENINGYLVTNGSTVYISTNNLSPAPSNNVGMISMYVSLDSYSNMETTQSIKVGSYNSSHVYSEKNFSLGMLPEEIDV